MKHLSRLALRLRSLADRAYTRLELRDLGATWKAVPTYRERSYLLPLLAGLRGSGLVCYDIGAANGNVTALLGKLQNVSAVCGFEPVEEVFKRLERRTAKLDNVRCFNVALGRENGRVEFHESVTTDSSSLLPMAQRHAEEFPHTAITVQRVVEVRRLDDLVAEKQLKPPDFVKIDVQGAELDVIAGGLDTLSRASFCIVEMSFLDLYVGGATIDAVIERMKEIGFEVVGFVNPLIGKSGDVLQVDGQFRRRR